MRGGVHEAGVNGAELGEGEELTAVLVRFELEGSRLEEGRSARPVVRVELVPVVEHGRGEALSGRVGVGIRHSLGGWGGGGGVRGVGMC